MRRVIFCFYVFINRLLLILLFIDNILINRLSLNNLRFTEKIEKKQSSHILPSLNPQFSLLLTSCSIEVQLLKLMSQY